MTPPVIWLDVTETLASGMRTGIQRVTIELARQLLSQQRGQLIRLEPKKRDFALLTDDETASLLGATSKVQTQGWQRWAARWGLVPVLGTIKDALLAVSLWKPRHPSFDWAGGTYLTAEVLGNVVRYDAVSHLQKTIPTVLMFHDLFPLTAPEFSALRPQAFVRHWNLAVNATALVAVSRHTQKDALEYAARRGQSLPPITVAYPGHTLGGLQGMPPSPLPPDQFFLCVGTIEHRKNQANVLKAYRRYRETGGGTGLVVVGRPGPGSDHLVQALEASSKVGVVWYQDADDETLVWLYRHSIALIYPSRAEGFGLPLVEALTVGTPCITSDRTSTAEVAELCGGTMLVDPEDPVSLSLAMAKVDDPVVRGELVASIRLECIPTWTRLFATVESLC